jgi:hypothetical protein
MRDLNTIQVDAREPASGEVIAACEHVVRELVDGVRHGFFEDRHGRDDAVEKEVRHDQGRQESSLHCVSLAA